MFRRVQEIEASRAPQVLTIDHDDSEDVSSSDDEDDVLSDDDVAACSEPLCCPAALPQPESLPGIESGQPLLCCCSSGKPHLVRIATLLSLLDHSSAPKSRMKSCRKPKLTYN